MSRRTVALALAAFALAGCVRVVYVWKHPEATLEDERRDSAECGLSDPRLSLGEYQRCMEARRYTLHAKRYGLTSPEWVRRLWDRVTRMLAPSGA